MLVLMFDLSCENLFLLRIKLEFDDFFNDSLS